MNFFQSNVGFWGMFHLARRCHQSGRDQIGFAGNAENTWTFSFFGHLRSKMTDMQGEVTKQDLVI